MATGFPAPFIKFREDDANGLPLAGGLLYSYVAGTSSGLPTYTTPALNVANLNPTVLDASGRASVFIPDGVGYKFVLTDKIGNLIWSVDNVMVPQVAAAAVPGAVPAGGIIAFGGIAAPAGWLLCDGGTYSTAGIYNPLFLAIGQTYGGSGGVFQVPNLQQRFPLGKAPSGAAGSLGAAAGLFNHVHSGPSHTHTIPAHFHAAPVHLHQVPYNGWTTVVQSNAGLMAGILQAGGYGSGSESTISQASANNLTVNSAPANTDSKALTTDADGIASTGTADPPYLVVNYIIKL
jgi:microcystin-dependent protein